MANICLAFRNRFHEWYCMYRYCEDAFSTYTNLNEWRRKKNKPTQIQQLLPTLGGTTNSIQKRLYKMAIYFAREPFYGHFFYLKFACMRNIRGAFQFSCAIFISISNKLNIEYLPFWCNLSDTYPHRIHTNTHAIHIMMIWIGKFYLIVILQLRTKGPHER